MEAEELWDERRKERAHQQAQQGVGEGGKQVDEGGHGAQGHHCVAHHIHPQEEDAKAGQDVSQADQGMLFAEHGDGHACKGKSRGQGAHVQSNHLACDGRPDIGAHDDANRLGQCHQPGIDKTHHHHGGR